jgi:hypothetical protein
MAGEKTTRPLFDDTVPVSSRRCILELFHIDHDGVCGERYTIGLNIEGIAKRATQLGECLTKGCSRAIFVLVTPQQLCQDGSRHQSRRASREERQQDQLLSPTRKAVSSGANIDQL